MDNHRVSISLVIDDDKLYNSFILPNKHQRTLNNIVVKCLTAYFYDENVRNMILGSMANVSRDSSTDKTIQEKLAEIRGTLTMQDYYVQQMNDLVAEGQEVTDDVLQRANNRATQQGNFTSQRTSSGSQMLLPVDETPRLLMENEKEMLSLNAKIDSIYKMLGVMLQSGKIQIEQDNEIEPTKQLEKPNNVEETMHTEIEETPTISEPIQTEVKELDNNESEFDGFAEDTPAPPPDPEEDSSDALAALLGSL